MGGLLVKAELTRPDLLVPVSSLVLIGRSESGPARH